MPRTGIQELLPDSQKENEDMLYCMFSLMDQPWINTKTELAASVSEWVSGVLRQPINQPVEHLSPPLPVSALRSTAAARSPQEATG